MTSYNSQWREFRQSIIESDGHKCTICGASGDGVVLQVHHKKYISGRLPWDYASKDCMTLCRGCHAAEHGIIRPKFGWQYLGDEDLGDLIGNCERCGTDIRYAFYVYHENWGTLQVGTVCCDIMTETCVASDLVKYEERKERFINSKRWKIQDGVIKIRQNLFSVEIKEFESSFYIKIEESESKTKYKSFEEAKIKVFNVIESGELIEYLKKKNISMNKYIKKVKKHKEKLQETDSE